MAKKNQLTTSDYLAYDEFQKLLAKLRVNKMYIWELYARISFCTALRSSDVLSLKWEDILGKDKMIIQEQKTKKVREISFNPSVKEKIRELYKLLNRPDESRFIFYSKTTKKSFTVQYVNAKLKEFKYIFRLNIGNFSTHTFRKTFGRYVYETMGKSAESLILLNNIFRHSSIQITQVYIGLRKDEINNVFNSIQF